MEKKLKDIMSFIRSELAPLPGFSHAYPADQPDGKSIIEAWFVGEPPRGLPADFDGIRIKVISAASLLEAQR